MKSIIPLIIMAAISMQVLALGQDWDKTFQKSKKVNHRKVTFHNRYGLTLAADLYDYDRMGIIPFDAITEFFTANIK